MNKILYLKREIINVFIVGHIVACKKFYFFDELAPKKNCTTKL